MRSRPQLRVFFRTAITPGETLLVELELVSASRTPIDGIDVTLRSREARYSNYSYMEKRNILREELFALVASVPAQVLEQGTWRKQISFALPLALPPTFVSSVSWLTCVLEVRVHIPWWPDRRGRFEVEVPVARGVVREPRPVLVVSAQPEQRAEDPYLEVSYEDSQIVPGRPIAGAVSVHNLRGKALRRLVLSLIAIDRALFASNTMAAEVGRWETVIHEGSPAESQGIGFASRFPADLVPSFSARLMSLEYQLEMRAVVPWGTDVTVRTPVVVVPVGSDLGVRRSLAARVPPVGSERRAQVWARVAETLGLTNDVGAERMARDVGRVALSVRVEDREGGGLWTVAKLEWPDLGIDVEVTERHWHDLLRRISLGVPAIDDRFAMRAREEAQARAFLLPNVAAALLPFEQATLGDDGCVGATRGGAFSVEELGQFVKSALDLAAKIDEAAPLIPAPLKMAQNMAGWRAFAERLRGRLERGAPRITNGSLEGERIELVTCWSEDEIAFTDVAVVRSDEGDVGEVAPDVVRTLESFGATMVITSDRLIARRPGPLEEPSTSLPALHALVAWSRSLRGLEPQGPFR